MSGISLGAMAVDRDKTPGGEPVTSAGKALVAAIPSEALTVYTAFVGVLVAANVDRQYGPLRWGSYAVFVILAIAIPLVTYRQAKVEMSTSRSTGVPLLECFTAAVAAAAWGLVMPGTPLGIGLAGNSLVFATTAITLGSSALLFLLAGPLRMANDLQPKTASDELSGAAGEDAIVLAAAPEPRTEVDSVHPGTASKP